MTTWLAIVLVLSAIAPFQGFAAYYGAGWDTCNPVNCWERIADKQGVEIEEDYVTIAHWDCERLGDRGLLWLGNSFPIWVIVADCTAKQDIASVKARDIIVEVPYYVAREYGYNTRAALWLEREIK